MAVRRKTAVRKPRKPAAKAPLVIELGARLSDCHISMGRDLDERNVAAVTEIARAIRENAIAAQKLADTFDTRNSKTTGVYISAPDEDVVSSFKEAYESL